MRALLFFVLLLSSLWVACGGDDDGAGTDGGRADGGRPLDSGAGPADSGGGPMDGGGGGGDGGTASPCIMGCALTVAADCAGGPPTEDECVDDCEMLRTGSCAVQYQAFLDCAEGGTVTCDSAGLPTVAACMTQRDAFIACLSS